MTSRLAICLILVLTACAPRTKAPPRPPTIVAGTERQFTVREVQLENGAITVRLEIPPAPAGPKPAVLVNLNDTPAMLAEGVVVVKYTIDWARLKGAPPPAPTEGDDTVGKWVLASSSPAFLGQHYLQQIAATATLVIPRVIDYLETVPEVDTSRLAITGGSTNGFIALQAIAADRRIGVATVIAACGDYHRFLQLSSMGDKGRLALDPAYDRWVRSQEVINHPRKIVHAALLMMNRAKDPLVPIACADATDRVLAPAFAASGRRNRYRYVRVEDAEGHGLGPRENDENVAWLKEWLLPR